MAEMIPSYLIQPSFTTGEISEDVSARIDLEQYKSALLVAENAVIRPYGSVCRRQGSKYIGECKYSNKYTRLIEFNYKENESYLLEVGERYIRIWKNEVYLGIELATPFEEWLIPSLKFTQSADVMFICSGKYTVMTLSRYGEYNWVFESYRFDEFPYEPINTDNDHRITVTGSPDNAMITSTKNLFTYDMVGTVIKLAQYMPAQYTKAMGGIVKHTEGGGFFQKSYTTNENINFNVKTYSSDSEISWKFVTHGTWTGTVKLEISRDNGATWKAYRSYTSNNDYNVSDSGTLEKGTQTRVTSEISSGVANVDLTYLPYTNYGLVKIIGVSNAQVATGIVVSPISFNEATSDWYLSVWNDKNGFPKLCTFFQDRLIFANTSRYSNYIWMSRTGDYANFGVEKVSGTITDDSAVTIAVISRKQFDIRHLVPANDLIILTNGNEWIIDGSTVITPSHVNPKLQTQYGCSEVEPQYIGNRCVYIQSRGGAIRDMGYSYESDNYAGQDLSLFAKHLIKNHEFVSSTYAQDPDSILYLVRTDGTMICLTYIREQQVYGWSHFTTKGRYLYAEAISEGQQDSLYMVVERIINGQVKRLIEKFSPLTGTEINSYVDCYTRTQYGDVQYAFSIPRLINETVKVLVDGNCYNDVQVPPNGVIPLEFKGRDITIGIAYETKIEQPNIELQMQDGTLQGRKLKVSNAILKLVTSKGGKIGPEFRSMDNINIYGNGLYTGYVDVVMPLLDVGFNAHGHVCISHSEPYPFNLLSIIREVSIGGGIDGYYR